jgi:sugar O-acyltransferase (sialic acid O-acetyltransferase NeuD family)
MTNIIFWGATGQARVLRECISYAGMTLIALFDNRCDLASPFDDVPLFCGDLFESWLQNQPSPESISYMVAIGGARGRDRLKIHEYLKNTGFLPFTAVHPTSFVAKNAVLGEGSQILAQSAVGVDTVLGKTCIVNTSASVDHECRIGDGVHIGPGAHVAGSVEIQSFAMVGIGATILPRIIIGEGAVVGAGAVVTKEVPAYAVVAGNPARLMKPQQSQNGRD